MPRHLCVCRRTQTCEMRCPLLRPLDAFSLPTLLTDEQSRLQRATWSGNSGTGHRGPVHAIRAPLHPQLSSELVHAATLPIPADAMITEPASHAAKWFTAGSIVMGLVMIFALVRAHTTHPLAARLDSQSMDPLTIIDILAIMALIEIECLA